MDKIFEYLQLPFVRYAFIVGTAIALCASLLGVTLVLRKLSFIGDGLSHVAFGAMAVAGVTGLTGEMLLTMPITIVAALILMRHRNKGDERNDAGVAMASVGALAFGYLLLNIFPSSGNVSGDICSTLFGSTSILTLKEKDVWICLALSVTAIVVFILSYNRLFAVTFDCNFAEATGTKARRASLLLSVTTAVVIVLAMNLVGSLLISALIIFPALAAMRVFGNFKSVTICSAVISVVCALTGMSVSILASTPVGSTIVAADAVAFFLCCGIGFIRKGAV